MSRLCNDVDAKKGAFLALGIKTVLHNMHAMHDLTQEARAHAMLCKPDKAAESSKTIPLVRIRSGGVDMIIEKYLPPPWLY